MLANVQNITAKACKALFALLMGAFVFTAFPAHAFAVVEANALKATAQVQTDGALHVVEQRTCTFAEEHSAFAIPVTSLQQDSKLIVTSIRYAHVTVQGGIDGNWTSMDEVAFTAELREAYEQTDGIASRVTSYNRAVDAADQPGGTSLPEQPSFAVDQRDQVIYLFFPATSERILFDVDYEITDAVRVFDDVAELYWDYVAVDEDVRVNRVAISVQLPMPEGMEAVPDQNVYAWGHGAAGTVDVRTDGTVAFRVPEVGPGQYAQAHVLFPASWLTNLSLEARYAYSGTRLDEAKAEEAAWTDTWSAWLANSYAVDLAFILLAVVVIGVALVLYLLFGREHERNEADDDAGCMSEWREGDGLPADCEAAIMGRLLRWNHTSVLDIPASIMQLASRGALRIDVIEGASPLGRGYEELRIRQGTRAKDVVRTAADQELFRLLYDVWGEGYAAVTLSDIARHAERAGRERFRQQLARFAHALTEDVDARGFFDERSARVQKGIIIAGVACFLLMLLFGVAGGSFIRGVAMAVAGAACLILGNYTGRLTSAGRDVRCAAEVLKSELDAMPLDRIPDEYAAYALELGVSGDPIKGQEDSSAPEDVIGKSLAVFWLAARHGRGGMRIPSFACALASALERWG